MSTSQPMPPEFVSQTDSFGLEINSGERFEFGRNWASFLERLDSVRIVEAGRSLRELLGLELAGKTFLDVGCGSGLFSLAARSAGAQVTSFDFDPASVACATRLRNDFFPGDDRWRIVRGSVLDPEFVESLGKFDVVYSWGVLHHTGDMRAALQNTVKAVTPGGTLAIALYNDQGFRSHLWRAVKRRYNKSGRFGRSVLLGGCFIILIGPSLAKQTLLLRPLHAWRNYSSLRGMSAWHDLVDWVGGYPFEVARPEVIGAALSQHGFSLVKLKRNRSFGCNEFVFLRTPSGSLSIEG